MNVPEPILSAAQLIVEPSHAQARDYLRQLKEALDEQESLRSALEEERAAVASKFAKLEGEFASRESARKAEFENALTRVLAEFKKDSDLAVHKIKDRIEASKIKKLADMQASELRRKSAAFRAAANLPQQESASHPADIELSGDIGEGDTVRIRSLDREGTVESVRDDTYIVNVGALRYRADIKDLTKIAGRKPASVKISHQAAADNSDQEQAPSELKVIGLTADEAVDRVDKFLDQAFLAGVENIRIIHGHGKGILRSSIAKFLTGHPQVDSYRLAPPEQGGSGATLVALKK
jgi:DNA mismatch repair protein MutS2